MKKTIVISATLFCFALHLSAQDKATNKTNNVAIVQKDAATNPFAKNAEEATAKLDKMVTLNEQQKMQVKEINLNLERRRQIVMQGNDPKKDEMLAGIEERRTQMYLSILNTAQGQKFKASLSK